MAHGWSFDGSRVEIRFGLPRGRVVVRDGSQQVTLRLDKAGVRVPLSGREFQLRLRPQYEWEFACPEGRLPASARHIEVVEAPADARCPVHQVPATRACARCGTFFCADCNSLDLTHCPPCVALLQAADDRERMILRVRSPLAVLMFVFSSMLGAKLMLVSLALGLVCRSLVTHLAREAPSEKAANFRAGLVFGAAFAIVIALNALRG
jgi:hypothetical protein